MLYKTWEKQVKTKGQQDRMQANGRYRSLHLLFGNDQVAPRLLLRLTKESK